MIRYTSRYINIVSFIFSIIICIILNSTIFNINLKKSKLKVGFTSENQVLNQNTQNTQNYQSNYNSNNLSNNILNSNISKQLSTKSEEKVEWYIEIPTISLKAPITEGTTKEILDNYVGHFEESPSKKGNVCLAAHNRGYKNNYFENLKKLKIGDEIFYKNNEYEEKYIVSKHEIIKDTDWVNLENTKEDKITLITCVENEPNYRRCIQGEKLE
ncbi:MAG: class D sortase [Clostridia bacterium]|nr:class D sortase [Clostridium sp.]